MIGPHWVVQVYVSSRPASVLAWPATPVDERSRPRGECRYEHLGGWWLAERCVRPDRVEVTPPTLDDDLSLSQRVEDFAVDTGVVHVTLWLRYEAHRRA